MFKKVTLTVILVLVAGAARAQIWSAISPTDSGVQFVGHVNESHSAVRPIEPSLSCYPFSFLPAVVKNHQLIDCHRCAITNPCTTGSDETLALGVCDVNGANCQWNCDPSASSNIGNPNPPNTAGTSRKYVQSVLASDSVLHDTETPIIDTFNISLGTSPTGGWWVHYHVSMLVQVVSGQAQCDLRLYVDAVGTPQRVASVNIPAGSVTIDMDFDKFKANGELTEIDVRGIGSVNDVCSVLALTGLTASTVASRTEVFATPK